MNLLTLAPLVDSKGALRYYIGAQIDVSGLVKEGPDLDAFQRMRRRREGGEDKKESTDEFQELSEMFNNAELETVRRFGGSMHRELIDDHTSINHHPRVVIKDSPIANAGKTRQPRPSEDHLGGVYKHVSQVSVRLRSSQTVPCMKDVA
jgi:hypothetical protein